MLNEAGIKNPGLRVTRGKTFPKNKKKYRSGFSTNRISKRNPWGIRGGEQK